MFKKAKFRLPMEVFRQIELFYIDKDDDDYHQDWFRIKEKNGYFQDRIIPAASLPWNRPRKKLKIDLKNKRRKMDYD